MEKKSVFSVVILRRSGYNEHNMEEPPIINLGIGRLSQDGRAQDVIFLLRHLRRMLKRLKRLSELVFCVTLWKNQVKQRFNQKKESAEPMRKSYLVAIIAALAAVAGALAAVAVYLYRREKELDEYEDLLFGDDEEADEEEKPAEEKAEPEAEAAPAEEAEAPAEEKAE
jgi:hypothetical protein